MSTVASLEHKTSRLRSTAHIAETRVGPRDIRESRLPWYTEQRAKYRLEVVCAIEAVWLQLRLRSASTLGLSFNRLEADVSEQSCSEMHLLLHPASGLERMAVSPDLTHPTSQGTARFPESRSMNLKLTDPTFLPGLPITKPCKPMHRSSNAHQGFEALLCLDSESAARTYAQAPPQELPGSSYGRASPSLVAAATPVGSGPAAPDCWRLQRSGPLGRR